MSRILAPHKQQSGWVYWRMFVKPAKEGNLTDAPKSAAGVWKFTDGGTMVEQLDPAVMKAGGIFIAYRDSLPDARVISSRRVEEDVETGDYLKRCEERGWSAMRVGRGRSAMWYVAASLLAQKGDHRGGRTLREAYYRYEAATALPAWATDAGLDGHDLARHQQETADAFEPTLGAGEES